MTDYEVHEVFVNARNKVDLDGWFRNGLAPYSEREKTRPRCALIAMSNDHFEHREGVSKAFCVANEIPPAPDKPGNFEYGWAVVDWNNDPARTKAEVLAAFDRAIAATAPAPWVELEAFEGVRA